MDFIVIDIVSPQNDLIRSLNIDLKCRYEKQDVVDRQISSFGFRCNGSDDFLTFLRWPQSIDQDEWEGKSLLIESDRPCTARLGSIE